MYGYVLNDPVNYFDPSGLKYTAEECRLLMELINDQKKMLEHYQYMLRTGKPLYGTSAGVSNYGWKEGCRRTFPDEGRRLMCEAHERVHDQQAAAQGLAFMHMLTAKAMNKESFYNKMLAFFEIPPTKAWIAVGERLYDEHCKDKCDK